MKRLLLIFLIIAFTATGAFAHPWFGDGTGGWIFPSTSTDNAISRYDGTTGNIQNSGITVDDSNNMSIPATKTSIHTFTNANWNEDSVTWTMGASGPLVHVTGNTTAVTATLTEAVDATTPLTYKIVITGTGGGGTATYTFGGKTGTIIPASGAFTVTDYITPSANATMVITPASACTVSITSITIEKFTDNTGDLTVEGKLIARSPVTFNGKLTIRGSGNGTLGLDIQNTYGTSLFNISNTGIVSLGVGSVGAPSLTFTGYTTTGFFYDAGIKISVAGAADHWFGSNLYRLGGDAYLYREAANNLQIGQDAATATNQTLSAADSTGAGNAGADLILEGGSGGSGGRHGNVRITPPAAQTIAAGNTITADGCSTIKQITAAGAVTTDTTNTFTAPAAAFNGCCMDVVNVGAENITLDNNANFYSAGAADVVLGTTDTVRVCSNGTYWYQVGATGNN